MDDDGGSPTKWRDYATKKVVSGFARMALGCDGVERNACFARDMITNIGELVTDATSIMLVEKYEAVYGPETSPDDGTRRHMLRGRYDVIDEGEEEEDGVDEELDEERALQSVFCDCKKYPTFCFWDAWCPRSGSGMYRNRRNRRHRRAVERNAVVVQREEISVTCEEDALGGLLAQFQLDLPILHSATDDCLDGLQCKICWINVVA